MIYLPKELVELGITTPNGVFFVVIGDRSEAVCTCNPEGFALGMNLVRVQLGTDCLPNR